jgi:hypothetical protein
MPISMEKGSFGWVSPMLDGKPAMRMAGLAMLT